jgi:uncharacterized DUF497 family protein
MIQRSIRVRVRVRGTETATYGFDDPMRLEQDDVFAEGEYRNIVIGRIDDVPPTVVYSTPEEDLYRIISARLATAHERQLGVSVRTVEGQILKGTRLLSDAAVGSPKPIGQTQRNTLEYVNQHVVVERPVEMRLLRQRASRTVIQHARGGMAVH